VVLWPVMSWLLGRRKAVAWASAFSEGGP